MSFEAQQLYMQIALYSYDPGTNGPDGRMRCHHEGSHLHGPRSTPQSCVRMPVPDYNELAALINERLADLVNARSAETVRLPELVATDEGIEAVEGDPPGTGGRSGTQR